MPPRFSVLLPTHNRADVVGYAVRSVLQQTESDFELLVVGDGCTDRTADIVNGFRDGRIRWFDLPKAPGFGYANRNIALKQAQGDYIAFMAHDDLIFPDHLRLLAEEIERSGAEWVYSCPLWVSTDGYVVPFGVDLTRADELEDFIAGTNVIPASCVLHRRSCFETYGYWPENVPSAADWRFWVRIIEGGGRSNLAYCRTPSVLHFVADWKRHRASSMPQMAAALRIAETGGWWPPALKLTVPPGRPEQQVFFEALQTPDYAGDARAAVERVRALLPWSRIVERTRRRRLLWKLTAPGRVARRFVRRRFGV